MLEARMHEARRHFPFSAMVGQEKLKSAYLANLVNPRIGGLLISGPKGTGKSTIVHSISGLLPEIETVDGCPFNCDPGRPEMLCSLCRERGDVRGVRKMMQIYTLPLSCTEDRLIGSINVERLLGHGVREVQAGILGQANRNILYVDEVNLLPDHLVDDILDAAASHWNTIEREGISVSHAADFVLVGSMNPEEGELRPQILDRFPLCARVDSIRDPDQRAEIVKRNILFEKDPDGFHRLFEEEEDLQRRALSEARTILGDAELQESWLHAIAGACADLKVDGQRPDIVIVKTAQAIAALAGRRSLAAEDVLLASELTLNHRTRDGGLLDPPPQEEILSVFRRHLSSAGRTGASSANSLTLDEVRKERPRVGGAAGSAAGSRSAGDKGQGEQAGQAAKKGGSAST